MRRAYQFRMYPTAKQQVLLAAMMRDHADLYNAALQERRDGWNARKARHITDPKDRYGRVGAYDQITQLPAIRKADPDQARWSATSQQQTLRRLNTSFDAFFRRVKAGQSPGYPRFKKWTRFHTVTFVDGDGARFNSVPTNRPDKARVYLQGIGHVRVHAHRPIQGRIKTIEITRTGDPRARTRWQATISCDDVPVTPLPATGNVAGIDLATGDNGLAWTSDADRIANPRPLHAAAAKIADLQRRRERTTRGSRAHHRLSAQLAKTHRKAANIRRDHHHKTALDLVRRYDVIAHEALAVKNMTKAPKPKPDPHNQGAYLPNGKATKAGLNRSILDTGWTQFLAILHAKAESAGRTVTAINPTFTSQTCPECWHTDPASRTGRRFTCTGCGHTDHADINAARVICAVGTGLVPARHDPA